MSEENETLEEKDGTELLGEWQDAHKMYRFEGDSGVRHLRELCEALDPENYRDMDDFLADNPGACDAIVEFICEWLDRNKSWKDNLIRDIRENTPEPEDDPPSGEDNPGALESPEALEDCQPEVEESLGTRHARAKRSELQDSSAMDLVQFLMSRGGNS